VNLGDGIQCSHNYVQRPHQSVPHVHLGFSAFQGVVGRTSSAVQNPPSAWSVGIMPPPTLRVTAPATTTSFVAVARKMSGGFARTRLLGTPGHRDGRMICSQ
jgi:hypothetical protein